MKDDPKITIKPLPVLIGDNYEHVMGKAYIEQTPNSVVITIQVYGNDARTLGDFVAAEEVVALSFSGVPVVPHHKEKN